MVCCLPIVVIAVVLGLALIMKRPRPTFRCARCGGVLDVRLSTDKQFAFCHGCDSYYFPPFYVSEAQK